MEDDVLEDVEPSNRVRSLMGPAGAGRMTIADMIIGYTE